MHMFFSASCAADRGLLFFIHCTRLQRKVAAMRASADMSVADMKAPRLRPFIFFVPMLQNRFHATAGRSRDGGREHRLS